VYVDDVNGAGKGVKKLFHDLGFDFSKMVSAYDAPFLGFEIEKQDDYIRITQRTYIESIVKDSPEILSLPSKTTPLPSPLRFSPTDAQTPHAPNKSKVTRYRSTVACLAVVSRPDLSYEVNFLSHFMSDPTLEADALANRVLRYAYDRKDFGIRIPFPRPGDRLRVYSDSAARATADDLKSQTGFVIGIARAEAKAGDTSQFYPLAWASRGQHRQRRSSMSAELYALDDATNKSAHLCCILKELGHTLPHDALIDARDVADSLVRACLPEDRDLIVPLDVVRARIDDADIKVQCIPREYNLADELTGSRIPSMVNKLLDPASSNWLPLPPKQERVNMISLIPAHERHALRSHVHRYKGQPDRYVWGEFHELPSHACLMACEALMGSAS